MGSVTKSIVVNAPVAQVFAFWENFENFPRFMENVESIQEIGPNLTHWKTKGPLGTDIEWDAETTCIEPNHKIAWRSIGGQIETHGAVLFKELSYGTTEVTVGLEYHPPGGVLGEAVARLFADPEVQLEDHLKRFKQVAEHQIAEGSADPAPAQAKNAKGAGLPVHGTPESTYSTTASDAEADIEGAHDASHSDGGVDGVRTG